MQIGIDLGATKIESVLLDENGKEITRGRENSPKNYEDTLNLTILFISHDLPVVRQMCDRIAVLKNGKLCEITNTEELFKLPSHEYTKELLTLMPKIESIYN